MKKELAETNSFPFILISLLLNQRNTALDKV